MTEKWYRSTGEMLVREVDGQFAVFNNQSGTTHVIDEVGAFVLRCLATPRSFESLLKETSAKFSVPPDELQNFLTALLRELDKTGLVTITHRPQ